MESQVKKGLKLYQTNHAGYAGDNTQNTKERTRIIEKTNRNR